MKTLQNLIHEACDAYEIHQAVRIGALSCHPQDLKQIGTVASDDTTKLDRSDISELIQWGAANWDCSRYEELRRFTPSMIPTVCTQHAAEVETQRLLQSILEAQALNPHSRKYRRTLAQAESSLGIVRGYMSELIMEHDQEHPNHS